MSGGVGAVFRQEGVPGPIWRSIGYVESGLNPSKVNRADPYGGSWGMFQENLGGQGRAYRNNPSALLNPVLNAQLAAPAMRAGYLQGKALGFRGNALAEYTATHSGHPGTAPAGSILPPKSWSSYALFKKEANAVGAAYSTAWLRKLIPIITEGSPSSRTPSFGGVGVGRNGYVTATGGGVFNGQTSPTAPGSGYIKVNPQSGSMTTHGAYNNPTITGTTWAVMLQHLHTLDTGSFNLLNPVKAAKTDVGALLYKGVLFVLALGLVFIGASMALGVTASDVTSLAKGLAL
ncbi:lysozyme family protein [Thiomonas sp.]